MKVIQIRGCNGAGKTTVIRQFCERHNGELLEVEVKGKTSHITVLKDINAVVLGRYDKKIGGCDLYDDKRQVLGTLIWVIQNMKPETIVFEGLIYGLSFKFATEVSSLIKPYGYEYVGLVLYITPEVAFERIYKRNGGKRINEDYIYAKIKSTLTTFKKLRNYGYNVRMVDTALIPEGDMFQLLEDVKNAK